MHCRKIALLNAADLSGGVVASIPMTFFDFESGDVFGDAMAIAAAGASHMEIHTTGVWEIFLRFFADESGTIHNQLFSLAHFFDQPVIPFRLKAGGAGFVNPANTIRISMYSGFKGAPKSALPAELLGWTP